MNSETKFMTIREVRLTFYLKTCCTQASQCNNTVILMFKMAKVQVQRGELVSEMFVMLTQQL